MMLWTAMSKFYVLEIFCFLLSKFKFKPNEILLYSTCIITNYVYLSFLHLINRTIVILRLQAIPLKWVRVLPISSFTTLQSYKSMQLFIVAWIYVVLVAFIKHFFKICDEITRTTQDGSISLYSWNAISILPLLHKNWVLVTNSSFINPFSSHPNVADLKYFTLWHQLDHIILFWDYIRYNICMLQV